jgi:hypothetical protein
VPAQARLGADETAPIRTAHSCGSKRKGPVVPDVTRAARPSVDHHVLQRAAPVRLVLKLQGTEGAAQRVVESGPRSLARPPKT